MGLTSRARTKAITYARVWVGSLITGLGVNNREGDTVRVRVVGDTAYTETSLGGLLLVFALIGGGVGIVVHVGVRFTFRKRERES